MATFPPSSSKTAITGLLFDFQVLQEFQKQQNQPDSNSRISDKTVKLQGVHKTLQHSILDWFSKTLKISSTTNMEKLRKFKKDLMELPVVSGSTLLPSEILMLVNQRPSNLTLLLPLIEDAGIRFSVEELQAILGLLQVYFPIDVKADGEVVTSGNSVK